jgi:hypothetical protein
LLDDIDIANNIDVSSTFDLRLIADTITIGGNATIDGIILYNGTTTKVVSIGGDLSGTGNYKHEWW